MIGSPYVQCVNGRWDHVGYATTEEITIGTGKTMIAGTWLRAKTTDDTKWALADGQGAVGFTTIPMDDVGYAAVQVQRDHLLGVGPGPGQTPHKKGGAISVRRMVPGGEVEFEGLGVAGVGNLVVTSGTGAIAANAGDGVLAGTVELSCASGGLKLAAEGDMVVALLMSAALTPEVSGNRRIRVKVVSPYKKPDLTP